MKAKYRLDTEENYRFLELEAKKLLDFGKKFPSPGGSSYWLGDDGTPWAQYPRETWITARMVHVYSIGSMLGYEECMEPAVQGVEGLLNELRDSQNGGWYTGIRADGSVEADKQCYAHAFVMLAASSALLAGFEKADELLEKAEEIFIRKFWDDGCGLTYDTWDIPFHNLSPYRGLNANMHTVEAFLALSDATGDSVWRERAGRIITHVLKWAEANEWRIPEHYTDQWKPELMYNEHKPDDPFKPFGATPGHGIEWARLIAQHALASYSENKNTNGCMISQEGAKRIGQAELLYQRAIQDGWNADGKEGIVYTTDWTGAPVIHDRMHWTIAEALNTSASLYHITGKETYAEDYSRFLKYTDDMVIDHKNGSWYHQLDSNNQILSSVWPGKPDLYHAFQAMLMSRYQPDISIASAVKRRKRYYAQNQSGTLN